MGVLLDANGNLPRAGQLIHEYRSDFHLNAALPSWLSGSVASNNVGATYPISTDPTTLVPACTLTTTAVLNARATLIGPPINTALARRITVDCMTEGGAISNTQHPGKTLTLGFGNLPATVATEGVAVVEAQNEASGMPLSITHASAQVASQRTGRQWRSPTSGEQPFIQHTLVMDYSQRFVGLWNHDQNVFGINVAAGSMPSGVVYPYVRLLTTEALINTLRVLRFNVTVEY